ncbi:MAG: hypothetical protein ABIZ56_06430, partial [Chthoniobacteraceae bacterium]
MKISGTIDLAGGNMNIAGTSGWQLAGGTIKGGTITAGGGAGLVLPSGAEGTLVGVRLDSDLTVGRGYTLAVKNGLVLNNAKLNVANGGSQARVDFYDTQTLSGTGEVVFGSNTASLFVARIGTAAATLTIGPGITVHGQSELITGHTPDDRVINQGTISADTAGQTITLNDSAGSFINTGILSASNGGNLIVSEWLTISGLGILGASPSGTLSIRGDVLGDTTNAAFYKPQGTVRLTGP